MGYSDVVVLKQLDTGSLAVVPFVRYTASTRNTAPS